jgi:lambda repressor-like predicted transcriptional regulator
MHPEQIKAVIRMKGVTPAVLAEQLEVAKSTMSQVISGRIVSARIRERIAQVTGLPVEVLWPPTGKPVLRRVKPKVEAQAHRPAKGAKS